METPRADRPCACGCPTLTGVTPQGETVTLDVSGTRTYVVVWHQGEPTPQLRQSAGYPVHWCPMTTQHAAALGHAHACVPPTESEAP